MKFGQAWQSMLFGSVVIALLLCVAVNAFPANRRQEAQNVGTGSPPAGRTPAPMACDSVFVVDENDDFNADLDDVSICPFGCAYPHVLTFVVPIDRVVGDKEKLEANGLIEVSLEFNTYGARYNCWQASEGYPCPRHRITINGHDITDKGGVLLGNGWSHDVYKIPASFVNFGGEDVAAARKDRASLQSDDGTNVVNIYWDENYLSSGRQHNLRPYVDWVALNVKSPRPVVLVPGNGSFADLSFGVWKSEFDRVGIPYDESLDLSFSGDMSSNASQIEQAVANLKADHHVRKVNVVAFSKGGIDVREYLAQYPENNDINHVVTLATPHLGTPLIDYYYTFPPSKQAFSRWLVNDADQGKHIKLGPGALQLGESAMLEYNRGWQPRTTVPFVTLGAKHDVEGGIRHALEDWAVKEVKKRSRYGPQDNDGLVPVGSANGVSNVPHTATSIWYEPAPSMESFHPGIHNSAGARDLVTIPSAAPKVRVEGRKVLDDEPGSQLIVSPAGVVPSGGQAEYPFVLEDGNPTLIICNGNPGLRFQILSPVGDSLSALADSGGVHSFWREDQGPLGESAVVFALGSPGGGQWALRITDSLAVADSGFVPYSVIVTQESDEGVLKVSSDSRDYALGAPMTLFAQYDTPMQCDSCVVTGYVVAPDTTVTGVALNDHGADGDVTANDGVYGGIYDAPPIEGAYYYQIQYKQIDDSTNVVRQRMWFGTAFAHDPLAALGTVTGDDANDVDGDGLIDTVGVTVSYTGAHSGGGMLRALVQDESGDSLIASTPVEISSGSHSVRLPFAGTELSTLAGSHPIVSLVELWTTVGGMTVKVDSLLPSYDLPVRAPLAYEHSKVRLGSGHSAVWRDSNSNGLMDSLLVTVVCDVDSTGTYYFDAWLSDSSGQVAGHVVDETTLTAGTDSVSFRFSAHCLGRLDGPQVYVVNQFGLARGVDGGVWRDVVATTAVGRDGLEGQLASVAVLDTLVTGCPKGHSGVGFAVRMQLPRTCDVDPRPFLERGRLVIDSATPGVRVWYPYDLTDLQIFGSYGVGDTIGATSAVPDSGVLYFEMPALSGCGVLSLTPVVDGEPMGGPLRVHVRSYDLNGLVIGAVDKYDQASVDSSVACSDFDWNSTSDPGAFAGHRSFKHAAEGGVTEPSDDDSLTVGEIVPIRWTRLYGDSARAAVVAVRSGPNTTTVIQSDMPDTGYVSWLIPTGLTPGNYEIQVKRHAGLGQGTDGVIGTIYSFGVFNIASDGNADRLSGLKDTLVACPGGDADSLGLRLDIEGAYLAGSGIPSYIQIDSLLSGVALWRANGIQVAVGDTINEFARVRLANGHLAACIANARLSGCGQVVLSVYSGSGLAIHGIRTTVHSYDQDARVFGAVDRLDHASWLTGATCDTCYVCGDFNHDGKAVADSDLVRLDAHLGHHIPRKLIWPPAFQAYSPGDTVRIGWQEGLGDSSFISIRVVRGATSDTTSVVTNQADGGTYVWTVPSTMKSTAVYSIQVLHTVKEYQTDYHDVGVATSDTTISIRPRRLADLTGAGGRYSVVLSWSESGQNGGLEADEYDVRYNTSTAITENNFYSSTSAGTVGAPGPEGTPHCVDIPLSQCHTYYFAIKTRVGTLWSLNSNMVSASTKCSGSFLPFCDESGLLAGGGGGGEESLRGRGMHLNSVTSGVSEGLAEDARAQENSLFPGSAGPMTDFCRLPGDARPVGGKHLVRLREIGNHSVEIDQLNCGYVDRNSDLECYAGTDGVYLGRTEPVESIRDADGRAITNLLKAVVDTPYVASKGEGLIVALGSSADSTALIIRTRGPASEAIGDSSGIYVQAPDEESSWRTIAEFHPRREAETYAVDVTGQTQVNLVCFGPYEVTGLRRMTGARKVIASTLDLIDARHSRLGDVAKAVVQAGGEATVLEPGDSLTLAYAPAPAQEGMVREFFLIAKGTYLRPSAQGEQASEAALKSTQSWVFSLLPARPNPSNGRVTFSYTLARPSKALLRLYNVAGRLVRTVVQDQQQAGSYEALWDGKDDHGARSPAGVYFYRLEADGWSSERKLVVIQP